MKKDIEQLDKDASENLKRIWGEYKIENKTNQTDFAEQMHMTQGCFSSYISGINPIGLRMLVKFSDALKCNPSDIRAELKDRV